MLTFDQIKELIELVAKHHLSAFELERSGFRLRVDGETPMTPTVLAAPAAVTHEAPPVVAAAPAAVAAPAAPAPADEAAADDVPEDAHILTSPIVGTFYRRPNPDADTFCDVGSTVESGQVLCIVEAMKLMNEIESDIDGEILKIYPKNAQPVEFGEPLFAIRPR